jgi:pimeloyl-ACP methyl ester carboxylesterase
MTTWVLLRGLAREARHWGDFPAALAQRLPDGDRVLAPDLPGNGRLHRVRSPASVAGMVAAVRTALQAQGGAPPYAVVGLSLGGMAALHWAQHFPHELTACVLVNSSAGGLVPFWQRLRPANYLLLPALVAQEAGRRENTVLRMTSRNPVRQASVLAQWQALARECPVSAGNALRQLWAAARWRPGPQRPAVPLLLLACEHDALVSVRCSQALAAILDVPLQLHPQAGHDLPLDDPHWLADRIAHWCSAPTH